ncbi:MAG: PepSY domain-containing protein [Nitrospirota bacterium]|nr:PepSY domain-containing protein [Nitrospirota bacterium]
MFKKIAAIAMITALLGTGAAFAEEKKALTLDDAVGIAQKAYPGEVVKKEKERGLFEVYVKTADGKTVKVKIDPASGDIVSPKPKK